MQSHPLATNRLIGWIQQQLADLPTVTTLLDLYCGVGILSLPLLAPQQSLTGIEGSAQAIALATQNAINLGKQAQATFTATSVEAFTQANDATFDVAICDPPRNGIKPAVLQWLSGHVSQALFYVSCDPATLARDAQLLGQQGWQLTAVQPVDMFPQTSHVETVCLFRRTMV
jgi:23S rRNA (uracil1939-C5)-methyltransferase